MAVGRGSLYRQLRMFGNLSPGKFILERRLQHAALLFTSCQKNVTDVAYTVGFKSLSHFSKSFRKHHGMTPMAYLKAAVRRDNPPAA
jgi:AraC-like DNA-binding protein